MIIRNQAKGRGPCHSHDFCDANMVMLKACSLALEVTESEALRMSMLDNSTIPWDLAWKKASLNNF